MKKVELAKAYEPQAVEDGIYKEWEESGLFSPDNLPGGERKEAFTVMMPPPNATGTLHIGHAMFLTLEDLMTRFNRMRGRAALWLPGTDHAAIATNTKVEKILAKEGQTKYDLGREGFVDRVKEFIAGSQETIHKQIRKMGASCDWSREAYTFDDQRSRVVREMFVRMYNDGLIYRGYRIVNWCPRCESTLADDEVEYKDESAKLYHMKYGPFVVATTRPETKLGDTAVAVHPEDERYKDKIGEEFEVDFGIGPQKIRVIGDAEVDPEFGTGVVGITPAHSAVDFAMAEKNDLPIKKIIGEDGKMTELAGKYAGMTVEECRTAFAKDLEEKGLLAKAEDFQHNIAICYRCSATVEPLTSRQWFVDVNRPIEARGGKTLKELSINAVRGGDINIVPDRFEKVYYHWMENLRDWCISRQIWFGHRVPVWYCPACHNDDDLPETAGAGNAEREAKPHGIIASVEKPERCPECGRTDLEQDGDTLDTWFSSGTWTFSTLGWPEETPDLKKFHPTSILETGYDILFFWIARMILMTQYAVGQVPFRNVYLHGLVRDEQGRKMSKSLENIIDPLDVAEKYGTDAVRLSLTIGNTPGNDLRMSEDKIEHFRNFTNKLWNISRFILMGGIPEGKPSARPEPKTLADRWVLARFDQVVRSVTADLEGMNYSRPGETLRDFTWGELADWYLETAKIEGDKQELLAWMLAEVLKLWHPFMPFVTEEIWKRTFSEGDLDKIMVAEWPAVTEADEAAEKAVLSDFGTLQEAVTALRNIRAQYKVAPGKQIEVVALAGDKLELLESYADVLKGLAKVSDLKLSAEGARPEGQIASAVVAGIQLFVPLGDLVDFGAEKERLEKELEEADKYLKALSGKLSNESFVARAPEAVVAAEKDKLAAQEDKVAKLKGQIEALG